MGPGPPRAGLPGAEASPWVAPPGRCPTGCVCLDCLAESGSVTSRSGLRGWLGDDAGPGGRGGTPVCPAAGEGPHKAQGQSCPGDPGGGEKGVLSQPPVEPRPGWTRGSEWCQLSRRTSPGPGGAGRRDAPTQPWGPWVPSLPVIATGGPGEAGLCQKLCRACGCVQQYAPRASALPSGCSWDELCC